MQTSNPTVKIITIGGAEEVESAKRRAISRLRTLIAQIEDSTPEEFARLYRPGGAKGPTFSAQAAPVRRH